MKGMSQFLQTSCYLILETIAVKSMMTGENIETSCEKRIRANGTLLFCRNYAISARKTLSHLTRPDNARDRLAGFSKYRTFWPSTVNFLCFHEVVNDNTSGSLGEREKLWRHGP